MRIFFAVLSSALLLASGCNTIPPRVTFNPTAPIDTAKEFFVSANRQQDQIVEALHSAGLKTTNRSFLAGYQIEASVGRGRQTFECGALNSVKFEITQNQKKVMEMAGRGKTGNCKPSIFDDMAAKIVQESGS